MVVVGLEPLVVLWTGWGIHFMVLVSFTVQVTLLLLADIRRGIDWVLLKVVIWLAYVLADTAAIYALGHMSVVCKSPEHQLMALWAPLLLVHLGGQDNITAYAIEDNRLWLRHLQTFMLQVAAAGYVLYVSSILSNPLSKVSLAAILMFVVGVLKYGERIWALKRSNSFASSSLSATSYDKLSVPRTAGDKWLSGLPSRRCKMLIQIMAYSLLDVPKQMFEGPTSYVQISNVGTQHSARYMLRVVMMQLSMMYDLLYTKAAVVHTWYGLCSRVLISLPFTITALALFRSSSLAAYKRADVAVTNVLLIGAVVLEIMSVVRAIFSGWTAVLLYGYGWSTIGYLVFIVPFAIGRARGACWQARLTFCTKSGRVAMTRGFSWIGRMGQHDLFVLMGHHYKYSVGRKMAKRMRVEDWWDSNVYSWSTVVPDHAIEKLLDLVSSTTTDDNITKSQGLNAVRRHMNQEQLADWIWTEEELKLEERILVWHIATHVYLNVYLKYINNDTWKVRKETEAAEALANYMFFLLAARPYMLPYPVTRQAYVQLCHDAITYSTDKSLVDAILNQKEGLVNGTPLLLQPDDEGIGRRRQGIGEGETSAAPTTLDRACQLAAKLIHITATPPPEEDQNKSTMVKRSRKKRTPQTEERVDGNKLEYEVVLNMILEVWVEMLCYTAYRCNENYHARHLTNGGEFLTVITLFMIYRKNGFH